MTLYQGSNFIYPFPLSFSFFFFLFFFKLGKELLGGGSSRPPKTHQYTSVAPLPSQRIILPFRFAVTHCLRKYSSYAWPFVRSHPSSRPIMLSVNFIRSLFLIWPSLLFSVCRGILSWFGCWSNIFNVYLFSVILY